MSNDDTDVEAGNAATAAPNVEEEHRTARRSTAIFMAATFVSRIVGFTRDVTVAAMFGASGALSAFTVAFQIPNLIRSLLADSALTGSFVPVFTGLKEEGEVDRAWRVASSIISLILVVLGPLTILCIACAQWIVPLFVADTFGYTDLAIDLFQILMPVVILMALGGVIVGILNSYDHFTVPAIAPIAWNLVIVAALLVGVHWFPPEDRMYVYAVGVILGTFVQVVMPIPWLRGRGGRISASFSWRDPAVRAILILMLPVTISLGLSNITLLVNTFFATLIGGTVGDQGPAVLDRAFRLYILPQGIFSVAVSTVLFPMLARFVTRGTFGDFRRTFAGGLRQIVVILVPSSIFLMALATPITRLVYQHGNFDAAQTELVAGALVGFSIGLLFNGASLLLIRSFFSLKLPWIATGAALINLVVTAGLCAVLYEPYELTGIAVATSIANIVSFTGLYVMLQRQVGSLGTRTTVRAGVISLGVSVIVSAAGYAAWYGLDSALGRSLPAQVISVGGAFVVAVGMYLPIASKLRLINVRGVVNVARRRGRPTSEDQEAMDQADHGGSKE